MEQTVRVRVLESSERGWMARLLEERWGSVLMVSRGVLYDLREMPAFVAVLGGERVGLLTYRMADGECEIMSMDSLREEAGVGGALIAAVYDAARASGCKRLWLITTNDNMHALRFYQRRGFRLAALYPDALEVSRRLKPEIPLTGLDGIPLRDELELEMPLTS